MENLTGWISSDLSLWGLFISSFFAATLLPGGSEAVLFGVLKAYPETLWIALGIATVGNTLGGMVTFGMGWLLPQRKGGSKAAGHPPAYSSRVQTQATQARRKSAATTRWSEALWCGSGRIAPSPANGWLRQ